MPTLPPMPIDYAIDDERRLLVTTAHGELRDEDLLDYARRIRDDEDVRRADHEYVDLRGVTSGEGITSDGIRRLADFWRASYDRIAGGKLALLADSDLGYGLARMYQTLREDGPDRISVFREKHEALAWLESGI